MNYQEGATAIERNGQVGGHKAWGWACCNDFYTSSMLVLSEGGFFYVWG